jgi:hypothetical protein
MQQAAPSFGPAVLDEQKSAFEIADDALVGSVAHGQVEGAAVGSLVIRAERRRIDGWLAGEGNLRLAAAVQDVRDA